MVADGLLVVTTRLSAASTTCVLDPSCSEMS